MKELRDAHVHRRLEGTTSLRAISSSNVGASRSDNKRGPEQLYAMFVLATKPDF